MNRRSELLADRLADGARALATMAATLTDAEWKQPVFPPRDLRPIGVVIHHVASVYPVEMDLALKLAGGEEITDVTVDDIHAMNAAHARDNTAVSKEDTIALLKRNSASAAAAIRQLTDTQLDRAAPASLYFGAPVTCQFMLEDHPVRHSYQHLARIAGVLGRN